MKYFLSNNFETTVYIIYIYIYIYICVYLSTYIHTCLELNKINARGPKVNGSDGQVIHMLYTYAHGPL